MSTREPARTEHAAKQRYREVLQRSLSCLSNTVWCVGRAPNGDEALVASEDRLRLRRNNGKPDLWFSPTQTFRMEQRENEDVGFEWRAHARSYIYTLYLPEDREFMSWHWHPEGAGARADPHMHVSADHGDMGAGFHRLHIPTGRVSFEQVVRFVIEELDVRAARRNWDEVLSGTHGRWMQYRTWS